MFAQMHLDFVAKRDAPTSQFRIDPLGYQIWFEKDAVYKMDTTGKLMFQQSVKAYGQITDMDVINPMKYLVFFREQQMIGFFDNTFSPYHQKTRLSDLDVSYATLVCYSMQFDRFWVFDQDNSKLIVFNNLGKRTLETENLNGLLGLQEPVQMLERNGMLYLVDEHRGVYIFDMFGALINFVEVPDIEWIQVDVNNFYYILDKQYCMYNFKTKSFFKINLDDEYQSVFQLNKGNLYFLMNKVMRIFRMK
jgi:hypothetical protein